MHAEAKGSNVDRLGAIGAVLIAAGVFMATMPFLGPLVGLAFDGAEVWEWNRNRFLLHVLPGTVGALGGLAMVLAHRRSARAGSGYPAWMPALTIGALVIGLWNGSGPWLLEFVLPVGEESALMFTSIHGFDDFSTAHQLALEAVCHWIPAMITLAAGWAAWRVGRVLPALTPATRA